MSFLWGLLSDNLDKILTWIISATQDGGDTNKHVYTVAWLVVRYSDELHGFAQRTDNTVDDVLVTEAIQAAGKALV